MEQSRELISVDLQLMELNRTASFRIDAVRRAAVQRMLVASAVGGPAAVRSQLQAIVAQTGANELIAAGAIHSHAARLHSYELLAEVGRRL
jgi:alkanesulfonate monooxygenase SsuD/methylene tetrahydromethanopterin reductase-like flavin-dependent oxidoreductase (luciferase family)